MDLRNVLLVTNTIQSLLEQLCPLETQCKKYMQATFAILNK